MTYFGKTKHTLLKRSITVEPRFNEPLYNELLGTTNDFLQSDQNYSKMYGTELRFNEHNPQAQNVKFTSI